MTPKEYLQQYMNLKNDIHSKQEQIRELEELASSVAPALNFSGSGAMSDKVGFNSAKIVDLICETNAELIRLINLRKEIISVIDLVENSTLRLLLVKRYIKGEYWEKIAVDMNYSYVHIVHRLHPQALAAFAKIFSEISKCNRM